MCIQIGHRGPQSWGGWGSRSPRFWAGSRGGSQDGSWGSWTGREILFYVIIQEVYSKVVTFERNRKICPEVAVNEQCLPGKSKLFLNCLKNSKIFKNLPQKSKFFKNLPGKIKNFQKFAWKNQNCS